MPTQCTQCLAVPGFSLLLFRDACFAVRAGVFSLSLMSMWLFLLERIYGMAAVVSSSVSHFLFFFFAFLDDVLLTC